jgi:hypothetical protein
MWQKTIKLPQQFVFKNGDLKTAVAVLVKLSQLWRKEIYLDFARVRQKRTGEFSGWFSDNRIVIDSLFGKLRSSTFLRHVLLLDNK